MTSRPIVILGASGYARETADLVAELAPSQGWELLGFADRDDEHRGEVLNGLPIVGRLSNLAGVEGLHAVVGAGEIGPRGRQLAEIAAMRLPTPTLVHPSAWISPHAQVGGGTVVCAGATVTANSVVGDHVMLNVGVSVAHDIRVGDRCVLSPGTRISGWVTIEDECYFGVGALVLPRLTIGRGAVVGAGAVVTHDVAPGEVVAGVPARPMAPRDRG